MIDNNIPNIHTPKWTDSEIKEAVAKNAQKFGREISDTWVEGKRNPVQQLNDALDLMQFTSTK